jgi:glycosyltransferase involved in cell wall biosynthesis
LTRCDLHLHSSASDQAEDWFPKRFGCPESYADPALQYELCKARGMTFVTLTDHDTIAGGLTLVDRPDFFLSEEVTARFPENDCAVHVLAWNITPAEHDDIQRIRGNVYALVEYLRGKRIAHGLAHPLESPNRKLDARTLEKLTLLFSTFEVVNGRTEERLNAGLRALLGDLDARALRRLSQRHSLPPARGLTRRHAVSGGSDDHEHPLAASCFTEVAEADGAADPTEFLQAVMVGQARAVGQGADVVGLGLGFGSTTYRFLESLAADGSKLESPFADLMDAIGGRPDSADATSPGRREFLEHVRRVVGEVSPPDARRDLRQVALGADADEVAAAQIRVCDALVASGVSAAARALVEADFFALFAAIRDVAGGIKAMVPFLFAASHLGRQVEEMRALGPTWQVTPWPSAPTKLALFADTLGQVDGVSIWCRRFLDQAARDGAEVLVPHVGPVADALRDASTERFFVELPELAGAALPVYQGLRLAAPSFVRTLAWLQREGVSEVELATPGPFGLTGLLAAKLLRLPVRATYHTEVPDLVRLLTGSERLECWATTYMRWFYGQVEGVTVFSRAAYDRVRAFGVPEARIELRTLAVDPDEFSPKHATRRGDPQARAEFDHLSLSHPPLGLPSDRPIILSVGRLSPEKNLPVIIEAAARLANLEPRPLLVVAGEGPERSRLEELAARAVGGADVRDLVRFVGPQHGLALRQLYARASAFVFASELDTLGLVAMEAMSSGAPVLVARGAAFAQLCEHRRSGYLFDLDPEALARALSELLRDRELAATLSHNGRARMVARWHESRGPVVREQPAHG